MNESWSEWPAPAKLNLFLHIVGRREDGYHLLQTVFQLLDWGDQVRLRKREDGAIVRVSGLAQVAPEQDLAVRAAHALKALSGTRFGADIAVDKRIPRGAGLGGGSSDAATVLVALNAIWGTGVSEDELARLGLALGADVPLFVRGRSAWAEGIGECLTPLELPPCEYLLLDPGVQIATAELFGAAELTRNSPRSTITDFLEGRCVANAFASVVRGRYPQVVAAMDWLQRFGEPRLTGSGGCIFVALARDAGLQMEPGQCPDGFRTYRARGVNRSPLHEALAQLGHD